MAFQLFPSFSFDESDVGQRPVRTASVDRIGFVGTFKRGPATAPDPQTGDIVYGPTIVNGSTAKTLYGFDQEFTGSIHLQMAVAQGADDFVVNRVLPSGAKASLECEVSVSSTAPVVGGSATVRLSVDGTTYSSFSLTIVSGSSESQVMDAIAAAVEQDYVTQRMTNHVTTPLIRAKVVSGKLIFEMSDMVDMPAAVKVELGSITGVTITGGASNSDLSAGFVDLTGGKNPPKAAFAVITDDTLATDILRLNVIWPGVSGNEVTGVISQGAEPNLYDFDFFLPSEGIRERFVNVDLTQTYNGNYISGLRSSTLCNGVVLAEGAPLLEGFVMSGGSDGDGDVAQEDYIRAIDELKDIQCTILICPGYKGTGIDQKAINTALWSQAEVNDGDMGEQYGLRIAVISLPQTFRRVDELSALKAASYIPDSKRCVLLSGWGTSAILPKVGRYMIDPAAVYAGKLMRTRAHVSPAARTSSPPILGLIEVNVPLGGNSALNELTKFRCDALFVDPVSGAIQVLNGRTTSTDPAWYWVCIRRVYDRIRTDVFFNMQFIKSEPSTRAFDDVIQNTINGYLGNLVASRVLNGYNPCISNDSNNPAAIRAAGKRFVDFAIEPIYPNDFTEFRISRVLTAQVRLS